MTFRDLLPCVGALFLLLLCGACNKEGPAKSVATRSISGPGGKAVLVPEQITGFLPANGAVLDLVERFLKPEDVAAMPSSTLQNSNVDQSAWGDRPVLADLHTEELISANIDFVIAHDWQETRLSPVLERAGIHALFLPTVTTVEDLYDSIGWIGEALKEPTKAAQWVAELKVIGQELKAGGSALSNQSALVYSNYGSGGGTSGKDTTYDFMIRLAGLKNAAAEAGLQGHPPLDVEGLMSIQPDFLILPGSKDGGSPSLDSLIDALDGAPLQALEAGKVILLQPNQLNTTSHHILYAAQAMQRKALALQD